MDYPRSFHLITNASSKRHSTSDTDMAPKKKQKVGESSSQQVGPLDPQFYGINLRTDTERERWGRLIHRKVIPTRYSSDSLTHNNGIHEEVWRLIDNVGWTTLLGNRYRTYKSLTLEFLSTLETEYASKRGKRPAKISFRLKNTAYSLTVDQQNDIFDLPSTGIYTHPQEYDENVFFNQIVGVPGLVDDLANIPQQNKASWIRNPIFRYLQRLMALTVFARQEGGNVRKDEMYLLWCMVTGHKLDIGPLMMQQFDKMVTLQTGPISIGGLITAIACHFELEMDASEIVPGSNLLSSTDLATMRMFLPARPEGSWVIQTRGGFFRMPNTHLTDIRSLEDQTNWSMYTEAHRTESRDPTQDEHRLYQAPFQQGQAQRGEEEEIGGPSTQAPTHEGQQPTTGFDEFRGHVNERLTAYEEMLGAFFDRFQVYDQRLDSLMERQQLMMDRQQEMMTQQQRMYIEHQEAMARLARDYPPQPQ